jgi:hypothetical protein
MISADSGAAVIGDNRAGPSLPGDPWRGYPPADAGIVGPGSVTSP